MTVVQNSCFYLHHNLIKAGSIFKETLTREGILEILTSLMKDGVISISDAASRADLPVPDFQARM